LDAALRGAFADAEIELIRGGGGDFIVIADGKELWNKRQQGDAFPENAEILGQLGA